MPSRQDDDIASAVRALGLATAQETVRWRSLAGGVSSDIVEVAVADRTFCIKRALPRLKVAAVWEVPIERNAAEAAWLRVVAAWLPDAVPALLAEDPKAGLFAMEYLAPERYPVWKTELLDGRVDAGFAAAVGDRLGVVHARSAGDTELALGFAHDATFEAIRIEPYLRATARAHPELRALFDDLCTRTTGTRLALVHGDVSPKNILCGPRGPVFLDAECAWYGDPAFDLAFCLNHLLLKSVVRPDRATAYGAAFESLTEAYLARALWEPRAAIERRAATLLPALLLARVDGKSPVEYLGEAQRDTVRSAALGLLRSRPQTLAHLASAWSRADV